MENLLPHGNERCLIGEKAKQYLKWAARLESQIIKWLILINHAYYILKLYIVQLTMLVINTVCSYNHTIYDTRCMIYIVIDLFECRLFQF